MARTQNAGRDPALNQRGELKQAQGVGDLGARAADPGGQLIMGTTEVVQQLLVGRRLFQGIELTAVQVLQKGVTKQVVVVGVLDDGGDKGQSGRLSGSQTTLTHDQLIQRLLHPVRALTCGSLQLLGRDGPHHHRLKHANLADRVDKLGHVVLVEDMARLLRIRPDREHRKLFVARPWDRRKVRP